MTSQAADQIRTLTDQPDFPDTTGLRIEADPSGGLTLSLATVPAEDDQVVDSAGARVFLDQTATSMLDDKTLDANVDPEGRLQFVLAEQGM